MKRISAEIIFDGFKFIKNKTIVIDKGKIIEIDKVKKKDIILDGILCPGFVNAHCHLELSFLKNRFKDVTTLENFISRIKSINRQKEFRENSINVADKHMYNNGINVCADIVNNDFTKEVKKTSKILYVNFVEIYGTDIEQADYILERGKTLKNLFNNSYITLHSSYSVSLPLLEKLIKCIDSDSILSIHVFESPDENELFKKFQNIQEWHKKFRKIQDYTLNFIYNLPTENPILFVHNTFIRFEYYKDIINRFKVPYFVLCPCSNLRLSGQLPPRFLFENKDNICIGTDSLASNSSLSIIKEINTIMKFYPDIELNFLLKAATVNGARALGVYCKYGSFENGKEAGILLIKKRKENLYAKRII